MGVKKIIYRLKRVSALPYYWAAASKPAVFWRSRKYLALYRKKREQIEPWQNQIAAELEQNGTYITHIEKFFGGRELLNILKSETEKLVQETLAKNPKKAFLQYWLLDNKVKDLENIFVRLALLPLVLEIVSAYFKMFARIRFFSGGLTSPVTEGEDAKESQRWHRDPGVGKICKVFLYLTDVDESSGPFMYVPKSQPGGELKKLLPHRYFGNGSFYPRDGAVETELKKRGLANAVKICKGRAGTIIFCNTTGLHKGGYATSKERLMFTALYKPTPSKLPAEMRFPDNFKAKFNKLNYQQKLAVIGKTDGNLIWA